MEPILLRLRAGEAPSPIKIDDQINLARGSFGEISEIAQLRRAAIPEILQRSLLRLQQIDNFEKRLIDSAAAVEAAVRKGFGVTSSELVEFELKLTPYGQLAPIAPDELQFNPIEFKNDADIALEVGKRRCINHLLYGGAHFAAHDLIGNTLREMQMYNPKFEKGYQEFFDLCVVIAFICDERYAGGGMGGEVPAGVCQVDTSKFPYLVKASASNLMVLVHEASKGLLEVVALRGLPGALLDRSASDDERRAAQDIRQKVLELADKVQYELWDLRLGIKLWHDLFGEKITPQILHRFRDLVELPPQQFFKELPFAI